MEFTKDELILLRHGLDVATRNEGAALGQSGLNGLKNGAASTLATRFLMAVDLEARISAEYDRLTAEEQIAAEKAATDQTKGK